MGIPSLAVLALSGWREAYSPECVEWGFSEVRRVRPTSSIPAGTGTGGTGVSGYSTTCVGVWRTGNSYTGLLGRYPGPSCL
jgi:hypothetical protein